MYSFTAMKLIATLSFLLLVSFVTQAEDVSGTVKKAVEHTTLDQKGTKPFHLKAVLGPTKEGDKDSGRSGEVEIWWMSPGKWRRSVGSPEFHQIDVVNESRDWHKSEGTYYPEWLSEIAVELVRPVPQLDEVLRELKTAEVRRFMGQIDIGWVTSTGTAEVHNILRSGITLRESNGELLFAYGLGWSGEFKDYQDFHNRHVARTVTGDEVIAHVTLLEDLGKADESMFDTSASGGDAPVKTVLLDETTLRKNLASDETAPWPPVQDGPLQGNVTSEIVVDRDGKVREVGTLISENSAMEDVGKERLLAMKFRPFLQNGVPVQVLSQITLPFKTTRPAESEGFDSARTFFERGRKLSFLAAGGSGPYILSATFIARGSQGQDKGQYEDTWIDESHWRREASFGSSRYVRTQNGEKRYQLEEGADVPLLRFIFETIEPIPALDTFVESDWKIKRDKVNDVDAIRVMSGYESPAGKLDAVHARAYWFDVSGHLLSTYLHGLRADWSQFEEYSGLKVGRRIDGLRDGKLAARIEVTEIKPAPKESKHTFVIKDHEWKRAFTAEER